MALMCYAMAREWGRRQNCSGVMFDALSVPGIQIAAVSSMSEPEKLIIFGAVILVIALFALLLPSSSRR
jgi:hypothetical protein